MLKKVANNLSISQTTIDAEERHQSKVINAMRFPLIILVVLFHLNPPELIVNSPFTSYNIIASFFSANGIARLAVPTFFLISGYFYFYHLKGWSKFVYINKLRKRLHTLLIPFYMKNVLISLSTSTYNNVRASSALPYHIIYGSQGHQFKIYSFDINHVENKRER